MLYSGGYRYLLIKGGSMDMDEIIELAKQWADEGNHTVGEFIDEVQRRQKVIGKCPECQSQEKRPLVYATDETLYECLSCGHKYRAMSMPLSDSSESSGGS